MKALYISENLIIREMNELDIVPVCRAEQNETQEAINYMRHQMRNQQDGKSNALLAIFQGNIAGYVFVYRQCPWGGLGGKGIPGIVDLQVFQSYRRRGIASKLLDVAEEIAAQYDSMVYLDVCLSHKYGVAQRMYMKRGYLPDGNGVYYAEKICPEDAPCINNHDLTLCLVKQLKQKN